jgi:hypothetical protein
MTLVRDPAGPGGGLLENAGPLRLCVGSVIPSSTGRKPGGLRRSRLVRDPAGPRRRLAEMCPPSRQAAYGWFSEGLPEPRHQPYSQAEAYATELFAMA